MLQFTWYGCDRGPLKCWVFIFLFFPSRSRPLKCSALCFSASSDPPFMFMASSQVLCSVTSLEKYIISQLMRDFSEDASQEDIYKEISPLVQTAHDGSKMGSGKTHTMVGSQEDFEKRGLIPRSLEQIFDTGQFHKKSGWTYKVEVTMVELSRHGYFDLSSKKDKIETPNLSKKVDVSCLKDALQHFRMAIARRYPRICFLVVTPDSESESSAGNVEVMKLIEEKKELEVITSSIVKMTKSQEKCLKKFKKKKEKFDKFMDNMKTVLKDYYLEYNSKSKSDNSPCWCTLS